MTSNETVIFQNHFGSVTEKRVTLKYKTGSEDIPIGQISSVSLQHERNYFPAIGGGLLAVAILFYMLNTLHRLGGAEVLIMIIFILFLGLLAVANWVGHHNIVISSSGNNRKPLKVEMSKTREGREFVNAVKKAVFK
jgi:hypothetical protein